MNNSKNSVDNFVDKINFFEIFGLPVSYKLDRSSLDKAYFDTLRKVHPDSGFAEEIAPDVSSGDGAPKNYDLGTASARIQPTPSELNTAYHTLINPVDRAEYFLELKGVLPLRNQLPVNFAEEIFELRQRYDSIEVGDTEQEELQRKDFISAIKKRMVDIETSLETLDGDGNLENFRDLVGLLRFLASFLEKIDLKEID